MRQNGVHTAALVLHNERLEALRNTIESGNATLMAKITASQQLTARNAPPQTFVDTTGRTVARIRRGRAYKYRLPLPRWFAQNVWEFVVHEANQGWTTHLYPVNLRPKNTYAFDFVRKGDVTAVRELLRLGHLSVNDQAACSGYEQSLFEVSVRQRQGAISSELTFSRWQWGVVALRCASFYSRQLLCSKPSQPCVARYGPRCPQKGLMVLIMKPGTAFTLESMAWTWIRSWLFQKSRCGMTTYCFGPRRRFM
jgi:galactokinase